MTLALLCVLIRPATAQLTPRMEAPLYQHMMEVNAQWRIMDPDLLQDKHPVHFNNEAERIAKHLHLVSAYLRAHRPTPISASAMANRTALLADLDDYADRGKFPQNHVLPYRNPVFIDPAGTACAVGQLIIESGHRGLAERISREMNLAYVQDIHLPELGSWASEHGFTAQELAWIQPGYPPNLGWWGLEGGTNGPVNVLMNDPFGPVTVAGGFSQAGGVAAGQVALWTPGMFSALSLGVTGQITCGAMIGDTIYLGGSGIGGNNDLARWDGNQWSFTTVFEGKFPQIFALHVLDGMLFAAGESQGFVGTDDFVQQLVGTTWSALPGYFNGAVYALGQYNGQLVAGGAFTGMDGSGGTSLQHVALFGNASWGPLGDGLDGTVKVLLNTAGTLYAGGAMYANIAPRFGLAHFPPAGSAWVQDLPNLANYASSGPGPAEIRCLLDPGGNGLWVGGSFNLFQGTVIGQHLAYFNGTPDGLMPMASFNGPVNALAMDYSISDAIGVIAGGEFTEELGNSVPYLAEVVITSGVGNVAAPGEFALFPNPARNELTLTLSRSVGPEEEAQVFDAQGRRVLAQGLTDRETTLHLAGLAPGVYSVRLQGSGAPQTRRFLKL